MQRTAQAGSGVSRREFVASAAAGAAMTLVSRNALGNADKPAPSERITLAAIGVGDQGTRDMRSFLAKPQIRVTAVCDVEANHLNMARDIVNGHNNDKDCAVYRDYRELLAQQKDLDAVLVVTPDHTHAVIAAAALRAGKHVYCQKPFTHTVFEARTLGDLTRQTKRATQLGTANQAGEGWRTIREWLDDGAIGGVREVHIWSNRPFWPQGMDRPADTPPVPSTLDWDLWLGPAPRRPYHPAYLPLIFRGWRDFGTGALGDMGCYALDVVHRILDLAALVSVEGSGSGFAAKMWAKPDLNPESYPHASYIRWEFAARGSMPPVTLHWYDGGLRPPRPKDLEAERSLADEGMYFVGEKGTILSEFTAEKPALLPQARMQAYKQPLQRLPRSIGHHDEWIRAIQGGPPAGANFEFSSRVTEALLLGNVAVRFPGRTLKWDPTGCKVTNLPEANAHLHYQYREGWVL